MLAHSLIIFSAFMNFVNIILCGWLSHLHSHAVHVVHELYFLELNLMRNFALLYVLITFAKLCCWLYEEVVFYQLYFVAMM